ncbi:YciI family protein [Parenemella sanctibonifatiensis]|uniref:YCII-related domain-containing protein n=1 Tax=Parenemella sanctibonifatiensis TaxID=2016505 RepID=A0A255EHD3_9ACTN|nr:YciI family protein [Parenemella sanctibonifatiensis]OYN87523.1 hypothetical protein CGZ92_07375 [Parenemella sanctibonifatiensis]
MKYLVLLVADGDEPALGRQTEEQQAAAIARFGAFDEACAAREGVEILAAEALQTHDAATTVRHRGGQQLVTDGPYAEVIEAMGGFYLLEAPNLDVVLELVKLLPPYDMQINPIDDLS